MCCILCTNECMCTITNIAWFCVDALYWLVLILLFGVGDVRCSCLALKYTKNSRFLFLFLFIHHVHTHVSVCFCLCYSGSVASFVLDRMIMDGNIRWCVMVLWCWELSHTKNRTICIELQPQNVLVLCTNIIECTPSISWACMCVDEMYTI